MREKVDVLVDNWGKKFVDGLMTRTMVMVFLEEMESVGIEYSDFVKRLDERHKEFYE